MDAKTKGWRDVIKIHPAADLFPMMSEVELRELGEDIKRHGLRLPICMWAPDKNSQDYELLDGRNRLTAMELVGIRVVGKNGFNDKQVHPFKILWYCGEEVDPWEFVVSANIHRRHLTQGQKRDLAAKLLKATPEKSNRQIAATVGVDHKTVGAVRQEREATGEIPHVVTIIDAKGRQQQVDRKVRQLLKAEHRAQRESALAVKITALPDKRYGVILADPPWRFEPYSRKTGMDRAADNHYPTMHTADIADLAVVRSDPGLAARECALFLWATAPMMPDALKVMMLWGFEYKSQIIWNKGEIGTGYWVRNAHELLLIGTRGNIPAPAPGEQPQSVIAAPRGVHSEKPEVFYEIIERMFPSLPKIELFARSARKGWDRWGNEAPPSRIEKA